MRALLILAVLALPALGQQEPRIVDGEGCPTADAPELRQYQVRSISVELPFDFLNILRNQLDRLKPSLPQKENTRYQGRDVTKGAELIRDALSSGPGIGLPVSITAVIAYIENCQSSQPPGSLDVVYRMFTSQIPFFPIRAAESVATESADPVKGAGLDRKLPVAFVPHFDYNRASKAQLGASVAVRNLGPVETLTFDGRGSSNSRTVDGAFNGSWSPGHSWLRRLDWRAGYLYSDQPSENGRLKKNLGSGQLSALIRDFGAAGPMLRAGAAFEQGRLGSRFLPSEVPAGTLARADYAGVKLFTGLSWRGQSQTLSASYGLQLGATGYGFSRGFRKHIGDLVYQIRLLPRDHTPHEFDVRLSAGAIQNLGGVPVSERFFGGNVPGEFVSGESWRINASPIIRSFAQNELARSGARFQAGGDRFFSFNFTYAPTVWKRPLLPAELLGNQEFISIVEGQLNTAEQTLNQVYAGRDPAIRRVAALTADHARLKEAVLGILKTFRSAEDKDKGDLEERYFECLDETQAVIDNDDIPKMSDSKLANAGVAINAVLRKGGRLDKLRQCAADLRSLLAPAIDPALAVLAPPEAALRAVFAEFQPEKAAALAKNDLTFTRRVLHRFFHEVNLASIAPVLLFDAARIGPAPPGESAFRYGIGAGIRFSLASAARFTLAYAVNPNRRPGERRGALVLSLDVVDLFY